MEIFDKCRGSNDAVHRIIGIVCRQLERLESDIRRYRQDNELAFDLRQSSLHIRLEVYSSSARQQGNFKQRDVGNSGTFFLTCLLNGGVRLWR